ncbi:hypothetical protein KCP78_25740 [Salmonella enterica subsp. enterica]|nr:hypothetical protein KCP78_25740 [Salmonella enterica subsp. enterica]
MANGRRFRGSRMGSAEGGPAGEMMLWRRRAICFPTRATFISGDVGSPRYNGISGVLTRKQMMIKSTATNILHSPSLWRRNCRR